MCTGATEMVNIVIGSGPAGVSAAMALLARDRDVLMLDVGKTPDAAIADLQEKLSAAPPDNWAREDRASWMAPQFGAPDGQVRRHGSDFAMEPAASTFVSGIQRLALRASRAAGGLSNVWGSAVLPFRQSDIDEWPITTLDLAPHYQAVSEFMPISGQVDALAQVFPAFSMHDKSAMQPSPQAEIMLARLNTVRDRLAAAGVHFGSARQAVAASCRLCGMCLHGCPWDLIYSARSTLKTLGAHPRFTYRRDAEVRHLAHDAGRVSVTLADGITVHGDRIFLAAGVLETARILLSATASAPDELVLKDSQQIFLPMIHTWRSPRRPDRLPLHTLAQLFIEIDDAEVSDHLIHSQIYTWNEFYAPEMKAKYARWLPGSAPLVDLLCRRLIVAQIFLHSEVSARIGLRLSGDGRLISRQIDNPATAPSLRAATRKLARAMRSAGLVALRFAARPGAPGSSFHAGGTVPMAGSPGPGDSDILGRPYGSERIHVVDASVLPSIPATTITFSVMANAHRIASQAP